MLCEKNDLADVVGVMRDLAVDGLHDGVRFTADEDVLVRSRRRAVRAR